MYTQLGITFPESSQWHRDQIDLMNKLHTQIELAFPNCNNTLVNMTWFGKHFDNDVYENFVTHCNNSNIDNLFLLASEDPCFLNREETAELIKFSGAENSFLLGHFDGKYNFNFHNLVLPKYFYSYKESELLLKNVKYTFVNYNRKPRPHRTQLVALLDKNKLSSRGIITLGDDRTLNEKIKDIGEENQWWPEQYGIPHDIHSLGRLDIWQNHFLTLVSETDYEDNLWTFVTEKTWKPIIGLRPFIINGQSAVYKWLTNNGFRTFNNYWKHINLETCDIDDIHPNICRVIEFLHTQDLNAMYLDMLADLRYNKERFYEFNKEQKHKVEHIFEH